MARIYKMYALIYLKKEYHVIPSIQDLPLIKKTEKYMLKLKNNYDGIGQ